MSLPIAEQQQLPLSVHKSMASEKGIDCMKYLPKIICLICLSTTTIVAQKIDEPFDNRIVETPREISLPVVAVQPNCPVDFVNIKRFAALGGGGFDNYEYRNIGIKPIREIIVASTTGTIGGWRAKSPNNPLMPGQTTPKVEDNRYELVLLTEEIREKLNLRGAMRSVVVFMIISVEFSDGTRYDDEKTFKALMPFYEELQKVMYQHNKTKTKP